MADLRKKVIIIDYLLGNLFSVKQACETVGMNVKISSKKEDILSAEALILPGVGAFNEAMCNLNNLDLTSCIKLKVNNSTPIMGVCLGLQLLFTNSEEFGDTNGLDLVPGKIMRFPNLMYEKKIKVPHIAWNKIIKSTDGWDDTPLKEINNYEYMYFVHSFFVKPSDESCILAHTDYEGIKFCSSINTKNIFATQFHPEKSAEKGISIYKNWALLNNLI
jgi:glutamine amidotransferase